jgi:hypothetical protein
VREKLKIDYNLSISELKDLNKRDSLRRAAKEWLMGDINKSILQLKKEEEDR